jgi:hypothetical protein
MPKIIIGLILSVFLSASAAEINNFTVLKISGKKDCKFKDGVKYTKLTAGQVLPFGTTVKTGRKSTITLQFSIGNTFIMMPKTTITVQQDTTNKKLKQINIKLNEGFVKVELDDFKGHKLQVETPTAVCGAVGTHFVVGTGETQSFTCSKGEVYLEKGATRINQIIAGTTINSTVNKISVSVRDGVKSPTVRLPDGSSVTIGKDTVFEVAQVGEAMVIKVVSGELTKADGTSIPAGKASVTVGGKEVTTIDAEKTLAQAAEVTEAKTEVANLEAALTTATPTEAKAIQAKITTAKTSLTVTETTLTTTLTASGVSSEGTVKSAPGVAPAPEGEDGDQPPPVEETVSPDIVIPIIEVPSEDANNPDNSGEGT